MIRSSSERTMCSTPKARYFIYNSGHWPKFWLNVSDVTFIRGFREPKSVSFETGERWRLYSEPAEVDRKNVEVLVAIFESAPWSLSDAVGSAELDDQMRDELKRIVRQLKRERINSRADGWEVVDTATARVRAWSGDVPALYPKRLDIPLIEFHVEDGRLWLVRSLRNENLIAVSLQSVGSLYGYVLVALAGVVLGVLVAYPL